MADFLGWSPRSVRWLWVVGTLLTGVAPGIVAYTVLAIVMPADGSRGSGFQLEDHRRQ